MSIKDGAQKDPNIWSENPVTPYAAEKLIQIARTQLLIRFPFFGRLAMHMQPIPTTQIPTAAVDPKGRMYYNPYFINACQIEDAMFVVAHEVMHLVQRCSARFPEGGLHNFWNAASDIVVNVTLDQAKLSPRKDWRANFLGFDGVLRQKYEPKLITDYIYYDLIKEAKDKSECEACKQIAKGILEQNKKRSDASRKKQEQQKQQADKQDGDSGDSESNDADTESADHKHGDGEECEHGGDNSDNANSGRGNAGDSDSGDSDGSGDGDSGKQGTLKHTCGNHQGCCGGVTSDKSQAGDSDDAEAYNKWIRNILSAAESLNRGNLPGSVQEILKDLVKPRVKWKDIVRATGTPIYGKDRYSWKRYSRRGLAIGVHLPVSVPEKKGGLVFIDTSGSISEDMITTFCSEVLGILDAIGCNKIYVGLHDYFVYDLVEVGKADIKSKLKFARGGTSHMDVFNLADGNKSTNGFELPPGFEVGMIICFTDLETCFPPVKPKWPVIWGVPPQYKDNTVPWGKKVEVILSGKDRS